MMNSAGKNSPAGFSPARPSKQRVALLANGPFALPVLRALQERGELCALVTSPPSKKGRGLKLEASPTEQALLSNPKANDSANKEVALIRCEQIDEHLIKKIKECRPSQILVVDFGFILPPDFIRAFAPRLLNLHGSLLPRWRGANPIRRALLEGDEESGVCLIHIAEKVDAGNIVKQVSLKIDPDWCFDELFARLAAAAKELYLKNLEETEETPKGAPQSASGFKLARKFKKKDFYFDPQATSESNYNRLRALSKSPSMRLAFIDKPEVKIIAGRLENNKNAPKKDNEKAKPIIFNRLPAIACIDGGIITCLELQREGKKPSSGGDFLNGNPWWSASEIDTFKNMG